MADLSPSDRSGSSSPLSSLDPDPSRDPQLPPDFDPRTGRSWSSTLATLDRYPSNDADLPTDIDSPTERRTSTSTLTTLDPDPLNDPQLSPDFDPRELGSSTSSLPTLGSDPSQDPRFPPSPIYWDHDYPLKQIPPLRCSRAALHQSSGTQSGQRDWYMLWGANEYPARFNVEDIIIAGGVTVVQKIVETDSIVAVKIAVRNPSESINNVFDVTYDAEARRYMVTFEVVGFSHYLHGEPRLRNGYTRPIVPNESLPVGPASAPPLQPNAYDQSRRWVKSVGSSYTLNYAIRNFTSREFPIIFAFHELAKVIRLYFFAQDFVRREDGADWCEHVNHIQHIEHLLLNKAHPKFAHNGDIFLKETFESADSEDSGSGAT